MLCWCFTGVLLVIAFFLPKQVIKRAFTAIKPIDRLSVVVLFGPQFFGQGQNNPLLDLRIHFEQGFSIAIEETLLVGDVECKGVSHFIGVVGEFLFNPELAFLGQFDFNGEGVVRVFFYPVDDSIRIQFRIRPVRNATRVKIFKLQEFENDFRADEIVVDGGFVGLAPMEERMAPFSVR